MHVPLSSQLNVHLTAEKHLNLTLWRELVRMRGGGLSHQVRPSLHSSHLRPCSPHRGAQVWGG